MDESKPKARSGQRRGKAKQPGSRGSKADQRPNPPSGDESSDRVEVAAVELTEAPPVQADASVDPAEIELGTAASAPCAEGALVPVGPSPIDVAGIFETLWLGFETISRAYRAYAWRSIEETMDLAEKLTLPRSLDNTVDIRNEFTRKACDGFLENSQNIWRVYGEFAGQTFRSFERVLMWRRPVAR